MNCPSCPSVPLEEKGPTTGLYLDLCAVCGGAWLDAGELERFGATADRFTSQLEEAWKTLLPTPVPCPRCAKEMERAWLAEPEIEFRVCPACRGTWFDRDCLRRLRTYIEGKCALPAASPAGKMTLRRAVIFAACAAAAWLLYPSSRSAKVPAAARAPKTAASVPREKAQTAGEYERNALSRAARGATAETHGRLEEAEDEYKSAAEFYYAAILAAAGTPNAWRLELEYAKAGGPVARIVSRRGRLAEAEAVQKIRLDVFERHRSVDGQAAAWQGLAEISKAGNRPSEAAERYGNAAALYRKAGKHQAAANSERLAAAARAER